jgi:hypothetical protein
MWNEITGVKSRMTAAARRAVAIPSILIAAFAGVILWTAGADRPDPPPREAAALISRLTDREHVLVRIDRSRLLEKTIVPAHEINLDIDRREVLRQLFQRVAVGATTGERVEAWVRYLQDRIAHPVWPPMHSETVMLTDPIWILENRLGQCGQTNRVLVDGLLAAGIPARVVQLAAHVAAEAYYDGQWRFLDADWLNFGQFIRKRDGTIASTAEIYEEPELLRHVDADREFDLYGVKVTDDEYHQPYATMFRRVKLGGYETPYYLVKTATPQQERDQLTFGWDHYEVETR